METRTVNASKREVKSDDHEMAMDDFRVAALPSENKLYSQLTIVSTLSQKTFHTTHKVIENPPESKETITSYFKLSDQPIAVIEAFGANCHHLLAPRYTPKTHAVYDEKLKKYVGVISEEFPNFKSSYQDPLKEEDLNTDFVNRLGIKLVDDLDVELYKLEQHLEQIERRAKKLSGIEAKLNAQLSGEFESKEVKSEEDLIQEFEQNSHNKNLNFAEKIHTTKAIREFYRKIQRTYQLSKKDLENYRIKKGLAITTTASHALEEDDLHQNNLAKDGRRFDFDMLLWSLTYRYKNSKWVYVRRPVEGSFKVTAKDIREFPDINDARPFYWPTKPLRIMSDMIDNYVSTVISISVNAYPILANSQYLKLKGDPVFVYHQFSTLIRLILTTREMYQSIAQQHISEDCMHETEGKPMREIGTSKVADRLEEFKKVLTHIEEHEIGEDKDKTELVRDFAIFFKEHSARIAEELNQDLLLKKIVIPPEIIEKNRLALLEKCTGNLRILTAHRREEKIHSPPVLIVAAPAESKEPPLRSSVPVSHLDVIKTTLVNQMHEYKNPGIRGFFGSRTKNSLADELIKYAAQLKSNPLSLENDIAALIKLKTRLEAELKKCLPGTAMHNALFPTIESIKNIVKNSRSESIAHTTLSQ
jgi:hypothetical protein